MKKIGKDKKKSVNATMALRCVCDEKDHSAKTKEFFVRSRTFHVYVLLLLIHRAMFTNGNQVQRNSQELIESLFTTNTQQMQFSERISYWIDEAGCFIFNEIQLKKGLIKDGNKLPCHDIALGRQDFEFMINECHSEWISCRMFS